MASMQKTRYSAEHLGQITGKFAAVQPSEFRTQMQALWGSARAITDSVVDEVENENISTVQGAAVIANVTGSLFGWPEFHRELRPSDLATALIGSGQQQDGQ